MESRENIREPKSLRLWSTLHRHRLTCALWTQAGRQDFLLHRDSLEKTKLLFLAPAPASLTLTMTANLTSYSPTAAKKGASAFITTWAMENLKRSPGRPDSILPCMQSTAPRETTTTMD